MMNSTIAKILANEQGDLFRDDSARYPWDGLKRNTMPGYWLLGSLGKKVLRPGGIELTRKMLRILDIKQEDTVIEYAPGMGITAKLTLDRNPRQYVAIERDAAAARMLCEQFGGVPHRHCIHADASDPVNLPDHFASVIYGESMLTIHSEENKEKIISEVYRLLQPGGRYAMQEISVLPDDIEEVLAEGIRLDVMRAVRHPAWPKTTGQWKRFMEKHGFEMIEEHQRPVRLLEPERIIEDEGETDAFRFLWNILEDDVAISRIREIRTVFNHYRNHLCGYCLVCRKKG